MIRRWRLPVAVAASVLGLAATAAPVLAHAGALGGRLQSAPVPSWLVVLTGGGVIGASFLFTTLVTDHDTIREVNGRGLRLPSVGTVRRLATALFGLLGVYLLVEIVLTGFFGPREGIANFAVVVVWAGWWAGYTMSVYLVGNSWPAINPVRTLAGLLPELSRPYPERLGAWPSVVGLLALVWLEVVSPVSEDPTVLALVVLGYVVVSLAGAVVYGADAWFGRVDPVARIFRYYGRLAPVQRTDDGLRFVTPGAALVRAGPSGLDETAFVVALLWVTTYDGLVATTAWNDLARAIVGTGVPPMALYAAAVLLGFGLFFAVYRLASRRARRSANSYVTVAFVRDRFAPALVPIAAGYHLAHFLGYFVSLSPALLAVVAGPLSPTSVGQVLTLPGWFGGLQLAFVVLGHVLAVWAAHGIAFEVFVGRLQPIRSQYPYIFVMVFYTMVSMWIVAQPYTPPAYL